MVLHQWDLLCLGGVKDFSMKSIFSVLLLVSFVCMTSQSCSQRTEFGFIDSKKEFVDAADTWCYRLDSDNYIGFRHKDYNKKDGEWIKELVYISKSNGWNKELLSEVDITSGLYSDTLLFYGTNSIENQIIMWKQEGEHWSYIEFYVYQENEIKKIGDIALGIDCKNCDALNFPEERISISTSQNEIEIRFKGESVYVGSETLNTPYHSVDVKTDRLKLVYDGVKSSIVY